MPIIHNASLKDYAYYRTGGSCTVLYAPETLAELAENVREAQRLSLPLVALGGGTNSLVMDENFAGAFVVFSKLADLHCAGATLTVGAGVDNSALATLAQQRSLAGAAWMYHLPGQLGGTVRLNARCYGGEIGQIVTKVTVVTRGGDIQEHTDPQMFRGYKDTIWMGTGDLIARVEIKLEPGNAGAIAEKMQYCATDRQSKGQFDFPSCGCVFKNDYAVGLPSGMLLEAAGAKQLKRDGAEVSPSHANFVFNKGASSRSILELTLAMRELVFQKFGAWLEYEMEILGNMPADLATKVRERRANQLNATALMPLRAQMAAKAR